MLIAYAEALLLSCLLPSALFSLRDRDVGVVLDVEGFDPGFQLVVAARLG